MRPQLIPIFIISLFFIPISLSSQENILENEEEYENSEEILERLEKLKENPLDVNTATEDDLLQIPQLSPALTVKIISYRKDKGYINNLEELKTIDGINDALLRILEEFLFVRRMKVEEKKFAVSTRSRWRVKKPDEENYSEGKYEGNPLNAYNRVDLKTNRYYLGFLAEKDRYEKSYTDLINCYLGAEDIFWMNNIISGCYKLEFGEGLVFSPPTFPLKVAGMIKKSGRGIRPYTSTYENASLFGTAGRIDVKDFKFYLFFSNHKLDATLNEDGTVKNLYSTGLHRSESEIEKKDAVGELLYGLRGEFLFKGYLKLGYTTYQSRYDKPFQDMESDFGVHGFDFDLCYKNINFFGEAAKSVGKGYGALMGISGRFESVDIATIVRDYASDFYSPHSSAFAETDDENEIGAYSSIHYTVTRNTSINAYFDIFKHHRPGYFGDFPGKGNEVQIEFLHKFSGALSISGRYKIDRKESQHRVDEISKMATQTREGFRFQLNFKRKRIAAKFRTEFSRSDLEDFNIRNGGNLEYFNLTYSPKKNLRIEGRVILFDTDSYDSRIYEYESDLPGYMRNVALFGRGVRYYLLAKYKVIDSMRFSLKYSLTEKEGETPRTEFGIQIDIRSKF